MSSWFWLTFPVGIILTAVGFTLFARSAKAKRRFSARAEAVVIDIVRCHRDETKFRAVYEYTAHGNPVRVPDYRPSASPEAFPVGSVTVIRYDPHRPMEFIHVGGFDTAALFLVLGILGVVVTGLSFLL